VDLLLENPGITLEMLSKAMCVSVKDLQKIVGPLKTTGMISVESKIEEIEVSHTHNHCMISLPIYF
jgi:hypothetical protein